MDVARFGYKTFKILRNRWLRRYLQFQNQVSIYYLHRTILKVVYYPDTPDLRNYV